MRMKVFAGTIAAVSALNGFAADSVIVESRKADGSPNAPAWTEVSGRWTTSKNKSKSVDSPLVATNVSVAFTNVPLAAFKVTPSGLRPGTAYKVEVTFGTSTSHAASPDLRVAVSAVGVSASTIPTNTAAFKGSGANEWNFLGSITPSTNAPTLTFTYFSGTLTRESRWYADAIRFTPETASK